MSISTVGITSTTNITLVAPDGVIGVDGNFLLDIDRSYLNWVPNDVHAFHWYGDALGGDIEYKMETPFGDKKPNERITELGEWENLVKVYNEELQRREDYRLAEIAYVEATRDYWQELRFLRDERLTDCDWTQLPDAQLTESKVGEWAVYRQQLRDLPQNITDPKPLVNDENHESWPVKPS